MNGACVIPWGAGAQPAGYRGICSFSALSGHLLLLRVIGAFAPPRYRGIFPSSFSALALEGSFEIGPYDTNFAPQKNKLSQTEGNKIQ